MRRGTFGLETFRAHVIFFLQPVGLAVIAAAAASALVIASVQAQAPAAPAAPTVPAVPPAPQKPLMMLHTDAFEDGARMPGKYTGLLPPSGVSPALTWSNVPPGTQSFVLLMHDVEEAPNRSPKTDATHWLLWNIPATSTGLPEGIPEGAELADGTRQVSQHSNGYRGPGPNPGANHHYVFELFALDLKVDVPAGVAADVLQTRKAVFAAMDGHVIGKASLVGRSALIPQSASVPAQESASGRANLEVIKPVQSCADLSKSDFSADAGAPVTIKSTTVKDTAKGQYCTVVGNIQPTIGFEVDLPLEHWTQRYLQEGCGGLCGMLAAKVDNAGQCLPALNGELVVASDDMGHQAAMGSPGEAEFGRDPEKRIDFAYRANHVTALVAKAVIKAYYGRSPKYSYFMGCSDGGREALMETQRFPDDFDGVSAGDPAALFQVQNSFYHAWNVMADKRAAGTNILMPDKRKLLHDAVLAHCDTLSGVQDGLLQDPRACTFDPVVLKCAAGAADSSGCLTAEELTVVEKLYAGATDGQGHYYTFGALRGGELQWYLPSSPTGDSMSAAMAARSIGFLILPTVSPEAGNVAKFAFDDATFARMAQLAPLYNAANTNLKAFAAHGGKLILWHGLSDTSITPGVSIAYYQGVRKFMGVAATDQFLRLFLLPGVGHCMGGDGYDHVDLLTPLMAWTEQGQAPPQLITGKLASTGGGPPVGPPGAPPGLPPARAPGTPPTPPPAGSRDTPPAPPHVPQIVPGIRPIAPPAVAYVATRPVYPWPSIARYNGKGDAKDATSYGPAQSPAAAVPLTDNEVMKLIGPDNQKNYTVENGKLVPAPAATALRAGVGKVAITSMPDEFPYTAPRERPYVGVHDDVYARALVLDDGKRRVALVVVEVTKLPDPTGLVKQVAQELGVPETNVLIAASHTHNVPLVFFHEKEPDDLQKREIQRLTQGTLEAVRQAKAGLQPAQIAFGRGKAWVNVNNGEQSGSKPYDPNGPSDKTLDVVKISKADGSPLALLVNYAAHAEVMFRSATKDGGYEVSGDLPGAVSRLLETQPGAAPVVLYSPAAEGDQVTVYKSLQPAGRLPAADEGAGGWSLLNVQARRVADSVMEVLSNIPAGSAQAHIETAATQVSCPGQQMRRDPSNGQITTEDAPPVSIPLSMIRINDIVLAGVGGDVASAIGAHFKATSPVADSTFISMANGSLGYLLTDASYEHPDHGVMGSPVKPHCAESAIVDGLAHLIKSSL